MLRMIFIFLYTKTTYTLFQHVVHHHHNRHDLSNMLSIIIIIVTICQSIPALATTTPNTTDCKAKSCGNLTSISYPFFITDTQPDSCGYPSLQIICDNGNEVPTLKHSYGEYHLAICNIFHDNNSILVEPQMEAYVKDGGCGVPMFNLSSKEFGLAPLRISSKNKMIFFFNCAKGLLEMPKGYVYISSCTFGKVVIGHIGGDYTENVEADKEMLPFDCQTIQLPVLTDSSQDHYQNHDDLLELLNKGFLMEWSYCSENSSSLSCICPKGEHFASCNGALNANNTNGVPLSDGGSIPEGSQSHHKKRIIFIVILASILTSVLLVSIVLLFCKRQPIIMSIFGVRNSNNAQNIEEFLVDCQHLAPKKYSYPDIKRITKSFREKLGEGGCGSVYKGALEDERLVAVKILSNAKGNWEEFMNEVASIGRTSHVNIVTLLGFCIEGTKRALIYDFMPNGSLERYIYSNEPKQILGWDKLYEIAVGVARGLEYLHRGCNMRIVHFDIKPHNILLDKEFCPKISDFGLAKFCSQNRSFLSMADPRGTVGFIAPEVFSRNFGIVSTKSDVYSYGMLVLEMAGGRRNINKFADKMREIYFPQWVYEHLDEYENLQTFGVTPEVADIARKIILVGLWCIQAIPTNRPSISRVIEMLEGAICYLQPPPKPFLSTESSEQNSSLPEQMPKDYC